jgi:hypothetical protein
MIQMNTTRQMDRRGNHAITAKEYTQYGLKNIHPI